MSLGNAPVARNPDITPPYLQVPDKLVMNKIDINCPYRQNAEEYRDMNIMTRIANEEDRRPDQETLCALVIDDETELSEEISEALEDSGIRAISTNSFSEALSILESDPSINIVLSDYFLEEHRATGMQLIDCCRTMFPDRYFRFGLMSGDRFVLMEHWQDTEVLKLHKPLIPQIFTAQIKLHHASSYQFKLRA